MKETVDRRDRSASRTDGASPTPDLVSHESCCLSRVGVPVGVVFALSMRLCLDPDLGVMFPFRNAATGDATSSLLAPVVSALGAPRLGSGLVTVTVWCCGVEDRDDAAIFGVRGVLFPTPLAAAALSEGIGGCLDCIGWPFSGAIFGTALVTDMECSVFRDRVARTAFLSRGRSTEPEESGRGVTLPGVSGGKTLVDVVVGVATTADVVVLVVVFVVMAVILGCLALGRGPFCEAEVKGAFTAFAVRRLATGSPLNPSMVFPRVLDSVDWREDGREADGGFGAEGKVCIFLRC